MYIDDDIKYTVRKDLEQIIHPDNTETLFIEIERQAAKNIIVGVLYTPPDQDKGFQYVCWDIIMQNCKKWK